MRRRVFDLIRKGGVIVYSSPDTTVAEAVRKMGRHNIGSILVLSPRRDLVGIFTERDLLQRVVVPGLDPSATLLQDVMTTDVIVVNGEMSRDEVLHIMDTKHIRHVPVSDGVQLLGVVSLRDVLRFENAEKEFEIEQLRQYFLQEPRPGERTISA